MNKLLASVFIVLICSQVICIAQDDDDYEEINVEDFERQLEDSLVDKREATDFLKRSLFRSYHTKNEEVKRETKEVYEEKCRNVVPTLR